MMKNIFVFAFILSMGLYSCNNTPTNPVTNGQSPKFTGEWKLEKIDLGTEEIFGNVLGNPTYVFNPDNTYVVRASGQTEEGTWKLKEDVLTLFSESIEKETSIHITSINEEYFIYTIGDESVSTVYLKR